MGVNKKNIIFVWIFVAIQILYAKDQVADNSVQVHVEKKLKQSLSKWGKQVKICQTKEEKNALQLNPKDISDLNISIDMFKTATIALNYKNFFECTKEAKNAFIYHSLLVYQIQQSMKHENSDALNFLLTSLPSQEVLESVAKYDILPMKVKSYFEQHIGKEPFNIVQVSIPIFEYFRK